VVTRGVDGPACQPARESTWWGGIDRAGYSNFHHQLSLELVVKIIFTIGSTQEPAMKIIFTIGFQNRW